MHQRSADVPREILPHLVAWPSDGVKSQFSGYFSGSALRYISTFQAWFGDESGALRFNLSE
jgi:hypothetical protein